MGAPMTMWSNLTQFAEAKSPGKQCKPSVGRTCWTLVMAKVHLLQGGVQLTGDTLSKPTRYCAATPGTLAVDPQAHTSISWGGLINSEPLVTARQCSRLSHALGATLTPSCHRRILVNNWSQMGFYSFPDYRSLYSAIQFRSSHRNFRCFDNNL